MFVITYSSRFTCLNTRVEFKLVTKEYERRDFSFISSFKDRAVSWVDVIISSLRVLFYR